MSAYRVVGGALEEYTLMAADWSQQTQKIFGKDNPDLLADETESLRS